jgi:hypothetical protein
MTSYYPSFSTPEASKHTHDTLNRFFVLIGLGVQENPVATWVLLDLARLRTLMGFILKDALRVEDEYKTFDELYGLLEVVCECMDGTGVEFPNKALYSSMEIELCHMYRYRHEVSERRKLRYDEKWKAYTGIERTEESMKKWIQQQHPHRDAKVVVSTI